MSSSSSLLEALRSERQRVAAPGCKVCSWVAKQDPEVSAQVNAWVEDGLEVKALFDVLKANGMPGCYTTMRSHVNGRCA